MSWFDLQRRPAPKEPKGCMLACLRVQVPAGTEVKISAQRYAENGRFLGYETRTKCEMEKIGNGMAEYRLELKKFSPDPAGIGRRRNFEDPNEMNSIQFEVYIQGKPQFIDLYLQRDGRTVMSRRVEANDPTLDKEGRRAQRRGNYYIYFGGIYRWMKYDPRTRNFDFYWKTAHCFGVCTRKLQERLFKADTYGDLDAVEGVTFESYKQLSERAGGNKK